MDVEIISKECIKPSSPTPLHLRTYKLCLLDQFYDHFYVPRILYYNPPNLSPPIDTELIVSKRLQILKQSLSKSLTRFYPIAGEIKDNFSIDCSDKGVYFVYARVKSPLNKFLNHLDLIPLTHRLYPVEGHEQGEEIKGAYVGKIQLVRVLVMKRYVLIMMLPSYFLRLTEYPRDATWMAVCEPFCKNGRFVTRRFVFDAKAIANLKAKASSLCVQNPSRVEVVTALLSKCIVAAFKTKSGFYKPTLLTHAINLRQKGKLSFLEDYLGNIVWRANALCRSGKDVELGGLVCRLREAITKLNVDFVKSLQGDKGFLNICKAIQDENEVCLSAADRITFSSWCNFGFYSIDFGWGKPIWLSSVGSDESVTNSLEFIYLIDTRSGDGIEAWVRLLEEDMALITT
ncbi:vinorine synthase-like [Melia azedarach]|uniref:Vinorine synthase-like n=1 Tax=Melia azedarach TaxID=155640 RepID=A0ACC1XUY8_MELAZ|nr:vinorine synthase-like [Melia azedarach]